jgi:hypothetical protein
MQRTTAPKSVADKGCYKHVEKLAGQSKAQRNRWRVVLSSWEHALRGGHRYYAELRRMAARKFRVTKLTNQQARGI